MSNTPRRGGSGGARSPPAAYYIHHNIRYAPEPPAYKTPKPEYPSYTRREPERPLIHERYITEKPNDEATLERIIRNLVKDLPENHETAPQEFSEKSADNELPEIINRNPENSVKMLEKYVNAAELEPSLASPKRQNQEAEFDPEQLLRGLEASPTEDLQENTQLDTEPRSYEEQSEGSELETDRLSTDETSTATSGRVSVESVDSNAEPLEHTAQPKESFNSELIAEPLPQVELSASELEILNDVQDLILELEPEIEEQEEIEPTY